MEFIKGNILLSDTEAIVNPVNCVGIMGRGLALQYKRKYPENFKEYESACRRGDVVPGKMFVFMTRQLIWPRFIINFPTKRHWRAGSRIVDIDDGLSALVKEVRSLGIKSISIPPLGCGLGGLKWSDVGPKIEKAFSVLENVKVVIYELGEKDL